MSSVVFQDEFFIKPAHSLFIKEVHQLCGAIGSCLQQSFQHHIAERNQHPIRLIVSIISLVPVDVMNVQQLNSIKVDQELLNFIFSFLRYFGFHPNIKSGFDDAIIVSKELELTLTARDCGSNERAPMCGVPYHAADNYIARLVERGYKVAVAEQMEDPKKTKTLVKREIIRIVTKGTITGDSILDESTNNYIASVFKKDNNYGISTVDVTTGEFLTLSLEKTDERKVLDEWTVKFY